MKIYLGILFFRLSLRCRVLWIDCVLVAFILQHNILCLYISIYVQYWYFKNKIGYPFLPLGYQTQKKPCQGPCHHWWCFALFTGLFVCCIFSQEEKDYSSSSSKWLFLNTSRNSSISSFEFGFIIFTT